MVAHLFFRGLRLGLTLPEASTEDIEWNGETVPSLTGDNIGEQKYAS
jgi:hypothetical protein